MLNFFEVIWKELFSLIDLLIFFSAHYMNCASVHEDGKIILMIQL